MFEDALRAKLTSSGVTVGVGGTAVVVAVLVEVAVTVNVTVEVGFSSGFPRSKFSWCFTPANRPIKIYDM